MEFKISSFISEKVKEYNEFMTEYHNKHKYCPKCNSTEHTTTLVGYILNSDNKSQ